MCSENKKGYTFVKSKTDLLDELIMLDARLIANGGSGDLSDVILKLKKII